MKSLSTSIRYLIPVLVILLLLLTAAACGEAETGIDPLAYLNEPFATEVRGELRGIAFAGTLAHRSAANGGQEFRFTAPAPLAGITVRREGEGQTTLTLGDIQMPTDAWTATDLFKLLLPLTQGQILSVTPNEDGSVTAVIESADAKAYTVTADKNGRPLSWECDGMRMEAVEAIPSETE